MLGYKVLRPRLPSHAEAIGVVGALYTYHRPARRRSTGVAASDVSSWRKNIGKF